MKTAKITRKRLHTIRRTNRKIQSNQKTILEALTKMNKHLQREKRVKLLQFLALTILILGVLAVGLLILIMGVLV